VIDLGYLGNFHLPIDFRSEEPFLNQKDLTLTFFKMLRVSQFFREKFSDLYESTYASFAFLSEETHSPLTLVFTNSKFFQVVNTENDSKSAYFFNSILSLK